ncbi:hypothetical protein CEXT_620531 [Caerostris extrusa]|uniref:Uncharacterized protein n=1 Tax=Caerostris extrusa TaxID=172846 RepID=A0AAV4QL08_CAEEX|nr:hypothetical protein CEXT_620531 [Caerostris extrusa]
MWPWKILYVFKVVNLDLASLAIFRQPRRARSSTCSPSLEGLLDLITEGQRVEIALQQKSTQTKEGQIKNCGFKEAYLLSLFLINDQKLVFPFKALINLK